MNKLVRDRIPEIIAAAGKTAETQVIEDEREFYGALTAKLVEEAQEVVTAEEGHLLEELGDVETLVDAILKIKGLTREDLQNQQTQKDNEKGTFEKRIMLIDGGNNG